MKCQAAAWVLLIFLLAQSAYAFRTFERYAVSIDGKLYLATVIQDHYAPLKSAGETHRDSDEPIDRFINEKLTPWLVNTYIDHGLLDPAKSQKMIQTFINGPERLAQDRRTFAFISPFDRPNDIEVMMSVAYPNLEKGETFPRLPIERRLLPSGEILDTTKWGSRLAKVPQGDEMERGESAELKNMAHRRSGSPSELAHYKKLLATLYNVAEVTKMTSQAPPPSKDQVFQRDTLQYYGETDTRDGDSKSEALLHYYLNDLGWEEVGSKPNPDMPGNTTHIIRLTRDRFVTRS
jgi:hypothetical protein